MTHDEFVQLAMDTARNAGGLRPLAGHVRRLYDAIRKLQADDNSFGYIAEVIQSTRNDKTDPQQFMTRVKTYHHRDRADQGDRPVCRRLRYAGGSASRDVRREDALDVSVPQGRISLPSTTNTHFLDTDRAGAPGANAMNAETIPPRTAGDQVAGVDRASLTHAIHNRMGKRRIVPGS